MSKIIVRPSDEFIKEGRVALWDQDTDHADADPRWIAAEFGGHGGAYIAGNPAKPDLTYVVADTSGVQAAIRAQKLVKVGDYIPPAPAPVVETPAAPVEPPKEPEASATTPTSDQPPAKTEGDEQPPATPDQPPADDSSKKKK